MADGSQGSMEGIKKIAEQVAEPVAEQLEGEVIQLQPEPSEDKPGGKSAEAKKKLRDHEIVIARREALRLQLGGAPTLRQLSAEQMRLNGQLGALRAERTVLKKELLTPDAEKNEDRSARLKKIESEIDLIEVRRADIGYWQSLGAVGSPDSMANPEAIPQQEVDILRRERLALQQELDRAGTGIFSFFKRRRLEAQLKEIDQRTRALVDSQRNREELAAK